MEAKKLVSLSRAVTVRQFAILRMQYRDGMPVKEIALRLGVNRQMVLRERRRALRRLTTLRGLIVDF